MKKLLLLIGLFCILSRPTFAQFTGTVAYQFFLDANNNCNYDPGETLIYNLPGSVNLSYITAGGSTSSAFGNTVAICPGSTLGLNSFSLPATNTLNVNLPVNSGVVPNLTCTVYKNLPYNNSTVYLPLKSVNAVQGLYYVAGNTNYTANVSFPVCSTIGNDSVQFNFSVPNLYTCNSGVSSRTFSLYLDGIKFDELTTTGLPWVNNNVVGNSNYARLSEYYGQGSAYLMFKTRLPLTIALLGPHVFAIKSTNIYNNALSALNYSVTLNSFPCTKISGKFYVDCNQNCALNANEPGLGSGVIGKVYNGNGFNMNFSPDWGGNFSLFLPALASYSLTQYSNGPTFTACTTGTMTIPPAANTNTLLFGYKTNTTIPSDIYTSLGMGGNFNPGTTASLWVYAGPNGTTNLCAGFPPANSGILKVKLRNFLTYTGMVSGVAPGTIIPNASGDTLVWSINNFNVPFSRGVNVTISNTVSLFTPFTINSFITPQNDNYAPNNVAVISRTIGVPYDPNSKEVYAPGIKENGDVPYGTQELFYTINFQNIGTAPAVNVKTLDTMDVKLDLNTLKILGSSFRVNTQIDHVSRLVVFKFDGINLPDATSDEPNSHGWVKYSIKLKNGVAVNSIIKNRGHNYFDFTEPVATNQTQTKLVIPDGIDETGFAAKGINLAPNPVTGMLSVSARDEIKTVYVHNTIGQLQLELRTNSNEAKIDFSSLPPAIYFVTVELTNGNKVSAKVIRN